jgi:hypothetical protein
MRCIKCGSNRMYGNGWRKAKSVHTHLYKCGRCGAQRLGEKRTVAGYKPMTPEEHGRRVSAGLLRYYTDAPAKQIAAHKKAVQDGLARRRARAPPREKDGFIGKLGDIEVYVLDLGVGRQPQGLPDRWDRLPDGHPKLESPRKRVSD